MLEPRREGHAKRLRGPAAVLGAWRAGKPDFPLAEPVIGWDPAPTATISTGRRS